MPFVHCPACQTETFIQIGSKELSCPTCGQTFWTTKSQRRSKGPRRVSPLERTGTESKGGTGTPDRHV